MAVEKWVAGAGVGLTWTAAFGTELNSLPSGDAVLSSVNIANDTALDMFADVDFRCTTITTVGNPFLSLYIYELLDDGTTYGDGHFATAALGPPPSSFFAALLSLPPAGAGALSGRFRNPLSGQPGIVLPPGQFKFVLHNGSGVALASSGVVCDYRTYNRQVV